MVNQFTLSLFIVSLVGAYIVPQILISFAEVIQAFQSIGF